MDFDLRLCQIEVINCPSAKALKNPADDDGVSSGGGVYGIGT